MSGNPGKMDRRVTIQARTLTRGTDGSRVETWVDSFDCWAEIVVHRGKESVVADADKPQDQRQFRIRYKSGLAAGTHRLLYQLKFYDIVAVTEEGRQDRLLLDCRSVQLLEI